RLVTTKAMIRSSATDPSPTQKGRYAETKGMTASIHRIATYESITLVATCSAMRTTDSSDSERCSAVTTYDALRGPADRPLEPAAWGVPPGGADARRSPAREPAVSGFPIRGPRAVRAATSRPSTVTAVSSTIDTRPNARVAYQRAITRPPSRR